MVDLLLEDCSFDSRLTGPCIEVFLCEMLNPTLLLVVGSSVRQQCVNVTMTVKRYRSLWKISKHYLSWATFLSFVFSWPSSCFFWRQTEQMRILAQMQHHWSCRVHLFKVFYFTFYYVKFLFFSWHLNKQSDSFLTCHQVGRMIIFDCCTHYFSLRRTFFFSWSHLSPSFKTFFLNSL